MSVIANKLTRAGCTSVAGRIRLPSWLGALVVMSAPVVGIAADPALQHPGAILVADVTGSVTASFGDQKKSVKHDERLRVDSTLTTERRSAVTLLLSNGALVQLGSDSELEFEEFGQARVYDTTKYAELKEEPTASVTRIRLARGDVSVEVKPLKTSRGSSFTFTFVGGALRISEGKFRAMIQMSDLGLGVATLELMSGVAQFEPVGGKFQSMPAGRKLAFAIELEKGTGNVKVGEMPKPNEKASPAKTGEAAKP
jgi:hypothetical protein